MESENQDKKKRRILPFDTQDENKAERFALWLAFGAAGLATLMVLFAGFYTHYQDSKPAGEQAQAVEMASDVNADEQAASMALATGDAQAQGMTAPADHNDNASEAASASDVAAVILSENNVGDDAAKVVVENGVVKFYFASGKSELADNVIDSLNDIVAGVKAGKKAVVSGFADSTGDAQLNERLSKERAFKVRDALLAAGIPESSIEMKKPQNTTGSGAKDEARRVEVVLQ